MSKGTNMRSTLFWTAVVAILVYMTLPAVVVVATSFNPTEVMAFPPNGFSLRWYEKALTYPDFQVAFKNSLIVMGVSSTLAMLLGSSFAYLIFHYNFRGRGLLEAALWSPLIVPHFTTGFGFLLLGSHLNLTQGFAVIVMAHLLLVTPFVTRAVFVSLSNVDPNYARAAANLGATPTRVMVKITVPLILPGMIGGWLIASILSLTEFTASLYVTASRTQTLPVAMYNYIREYADPTISAISALLILSTTAIMIIANHFLGLRRILGIDNG
ncbi:putative spermidine/putrescine transport system permease protein [Aminobacter niigataensis]|uniref:Spermidine/putrescine transport system permease protein n=1 Tax=Aminobacter niigataensis TaxID=83265 RepID=A0ABR6L8F3_9HYPH|nr:ABC transporter permease [Aminobacter niigataensis]MBB4652216.1 putative spermidine/putrescine transport system permease protein [Aminobacter niigataensis]